MGIIREASIYSLHGISVGHSLTSIRFYCQQIVLRTARELSTLSPSAVLSQSVYSVIVGWGVHLRSLSHVCLGGGGGTCTVCGVCGVCGVVWGCVWCGE